MEFFFFFHENSERFFTFFFMLCSYFQNNECKKISKFEREDESNGIPLLQHGFFFLHENFSTYILKYSLQFFFMLCSHFQNNQCKKISKFEREDESNGIPLVQHGICFFFHENFPVNIHSDSFPFFIMLYSYFLNNECREKFEIKEETLKQWKPTSTQRIWQKLC